MNHTKDAELVQQNKNGKPNLKGDYNNVAILFVLYVFQGENNRL